MTMFGCGDEKGKGLLVAIYKNLMNTDMRFRGILAETKKIPESGNKPPLVIYIDVKHNCQVAFWQFWPAKIKNPICI